MRGRAIAAGTRQTRSQLACAAQVAADGATAGLHTGRRMPARRAELPSHRTARCPTEQATHRRHPGAGTPPGLMRRRLACPVPDTALPVTPHTPPCATARPRGSSSAWGAASGTLPAPEPARVNGVKSWLSEVLYCAICLSPRTAPYLSASASRGISRHHGLG